LLDAIHDPKSTLDATKVMAMVGGLVDQAREVAIIAIAESTAKAKEIEKANDKLAEGDAKAAAGPAEQAIERYRDGGGSARQQEIRLEPRATLRRARSRERTFDRRACRRGRHARLPVQRGPSSSVEIDSRRRRAFFFLWWPSMRTRMSFKAETALTT